MHAMQEVHQIDVGAGQSQAPAQGRVYAILPRDHGASVAVVEGIFSINTFPAKILFDSGASHSFISQSFIHRL